ncbi:MAG TPA: SPOR domain-containing protein [Pseudomonadales bacterium]
MRLLSVCLAVGLLVAGCGGRPVRPPVTEVTRIPEQGDWFCQQSANGSGWECVQDPELAKHPEPTRLPSPAEPPRPSPNDDTSEARAPDPLTSNPPAAAAAVPAGNEPVEAPADPARQPDDPGELMQRPPDHWAVQVLAMATRAELDRFVERHGLEYLPAVTVERDGRIYHALLLGVFATEEEARRAAAARPPPLDATAPWIRPMRSLQSAMRRAQALAGSGGV